MICKEPGSVLDEKTKSTQLVACRSMLHCYKCKPCDEARNLVTPPRGHDVTSSINSKGELCSGISCNSVSLGTSIPLQ